MAKIRPPAPMRPASHHVLVQYTSECAITSSVISICAREATSLASPPAMSLSVPKASEWSSTRSVPGAPGGLQRVLHRGDHLGAPGVVGAR
jgi:hypothetical protein